MATARVQRRLAAIMATDIVGYSRLMETEETRTLASIRSLRSQVINPLLADYGGRVAKLMGDGAIIEFGSVVDAVACAVAHQRAVAADQVGISAERRILFRIGINLGDVVVEGEDLLGDGVNIAARLEALAEPGGICITDTVKRQLAGKSDLGFEDAGTHSLKNIAQPVQVYRLGPHSKDSDPQFSAQPELPSRTSIAVLPFANMSSDPEQEYFADGLAEDLITDLSKVPGLLVIARNSSFAYKGRHADIRSVAKDLGVRYVIEGSVRRAADRIRINAQLIDAIDNSHLWADRFDRDLADIFTLQDEVVGRILSALAGVLPSSIGPASRRATNLEAYDLFVRGRALVAQSPESNRAARPLLEKSVELDPNFAEAHAWLALSYHFGWLHCGEAEDHSHSRAFEAAQRAISIDPENADGHMMLGYVRAHQGNLAGGMAGFERALRINPNHAFAWAMFADLMVFDGRPVEGIECARKAFRLNPHPRGDYYWLLGWAEYAARRYEDAVATLRHDLTHGSGAQRILAASLAQLGRMEEARIEVRQFLAANPTFSIQHWGSTQPFRHEADRQHFVDGYLKAGLPE